MNVFRLGEKSRAFVTGCVAGAMSFTFAGQALGSSAADDPAQLPPATNQEVADVLTVVNGGGDFQKAIEISPVPYREYGAWLGELWGDLFDNTWDIEKSYMTFPEITTVPDDHRLLGQNSQGEPVTYYIEDIIVLSPALENGASAEDLLLLDQTSSTLKLVLGNLYTDNNSRNGVLSLVLSGDADDGTRASVVFPLHDYEFGLTVIPGGMVITAPSEGHQGTNTGFGGIPEFYSDQLDDCDDPPCVNQRKTDLERALRDAYASYKNGSNAGGIESVAGSAGTAGGAVVGSGATIGAFLLGSATLIGGAFLLVGSVAGHSINNTNTYHQARENAWNDFYDDMRDLCGENPVGSYMDSYLHCYGDGVPH